MFETLVPFIKYYIEKHHELYSSQCKAELWEELLSKALKDAGFGSDWKPDYNHKSGLDQTTNNGTAFGNKSGKIKEDYIEISGSRLGKHKTIQDKLNFLRVKKEDYILCLATVKDEWKKGIKRYYFIVINSDIFDYHNQIWKEMMGSREDTKGKMMGWECTSEVYSARIQRSMSDQLWTNVKLDACEEIHEIVIG